MARPRHGWINQDLVLYHGTIDAHRHAILARVNTALGRLNTDFGRGFYTTTSLSQARQWARSRSARIPGSQECVLQFTLPRDQLAALESLWFVRGDTNADDYWDFVSYCRSGTAGHNRGGRNAWFDVVAGPLARNWQQRVSYLNDLDQISFHTQAVELVLNGCVRGVVP